jgi:hypothetical protein
MTPIVNPSTKSLWPFFLVALCFLLIADSLFYFAVSAWFSTPVAWLGCGLLCYTIILRFYPPTPLIDDTMQQSASPHPSRPFSVRDVPAMVLFLVPTVVISPVLLVILTWHKGRGSR